MKTRLAKLIEPNRLSGDPNFGNVGILTVMVCPWLTSWAASSASPKEESKGRVLLVVENPAGEGSSNCHLTERSKHHPLGSDQAAAIGSGWMTISIVMRLRRMRFSRHGSIHSYTSRSQGFHTVDQMNMVTRPVVMPMTVSDRGG